MSEQERRRLFSGIVQERGEVLAMDAGRIQVLCAGIHARLHQGDSVAVNGVCLTVSALAGDAVTADVMPETLRRTTLSSLRSGDVVNLEPALALGDVVGGHLVTGHVDAVGTVTEIREESNARRVCVQAPAELMRLLAPQGSVAVDGISLTVAAADEGTFTVSLIPHTLAVTNADGWREGTSVNLEMDVIARYVQRILQASRPREPAEV